MSDDSTVLDQVSLLTQLTPSSKKRCNTCSPPSIGCLTRRRRKSSSNRLRRAMTVASSLALLCPLTA